MPAIKSRVRGTDLIGEGYVRRIELRREEVGSFDEYPFNIPAVRTLSSLELHPRVTFLIGENGSGKSTLVEAIAILAGFNVEGGTKNLDFATRRSESVLCDCMDLVRGPKRERDGFFLRAESFYNVATKIETKDIAGQSLLCYYGGKSFHDESHGESFLRLMQHRFGGNGLYILDEPEAALSPTRQIALLALINRLVVRQESQFIIATHSPIVMAYPGARIYCLGSNGIDAIEYESTEHYILTRSFLSDYKTFLARLFRETNAD